jgi:LPXTG-site transpeptidase (sortase) family protein
MTTNSASVKTAAAHGHASNKAGSQKLAFLALFSFIMVLSISLAASLDVLPNPPEEKAAAAAVLTGTPVIEKTNPELPTQIEIPAIGLSQPIFNPKTAEVKVLDDALLKGPVRYPSSSKLGEEGNVLIFGHSSYLPIVNNKAFKAFDGIQDLKKGDLITVTGEDHVYVYAVETVENKSAIDDSIPLTVDGSKLTLATCDSFGEKTDRFVVTATLVQTKSL